jgi:rod shape-determining protein MreC
VARVIDTRRSRLLLAALVVSHLVVIGHQVDGGEGLSLLQRVVFKLLSPVQRVVAAVAHGVGQAWSSYLDLRGVREDNRRLAERVAGLEGQVQYEQQRVLEAERLRELLELRQVLPIATIAAEVVGRDGLPWFRTLTLDKGREDGIALDAAVLSATGIVGRVVAVGPRAARVQLLLDRDSGVAAILERNRVAGVVCGQVGYADQGKPDLVMKYVSSLADVAVGDRVLSSGLDRIYPKGLVIGRVRSVGAGAGLFREVLVTPSAGFDRLEEVLVVRDPPEQPVLTETIR